MWVRALILYTYVWCAVRDRGHLTYALLAEASAVALLLPRLPRLLVFHLFDVLAVLALLFCVGYFILAFKAAETSDDDALSRRRRSRTNWPAASAE